MTYGLEIVDFMLTIIAYWMTNFCVLVSNSLKLRRKGSCKGCYGSVCFALGLAAALPYPQTLRECSYTYTHLLSMLHTKIFFCAVRAFTNINVTQINNLYSAQIACLLHMGSKPAQPVTQPAQPTGIHVTLAYRT